MNSQVADLVGDRDGGRASTPRSHPYPFPLPRITTAAKKPLTVEEADSFTSSSAGMTEGRKATISPNAIAVKGRPSTARGNLNDPAQSPDRADSVHRGQGNPLRLPPLRQ